VESSKMQAVNLDAVTSPRRAASNELMEDRVAEFQEAVRRTEIQLRFDFKEEEQRAVSQGLREAQSKADEAMGAQVQDWADKYKRQEAEAATQARTAEEALVSASTDASDALRAARGAAAAELSEARMSATTEMQSSVQLLQRELETQFGKAEQVAVDTAVREAQARAAEAMEAKLRQILSTHNSHEFAAAAKAVEEVRARAHVASNDARAAAAELQDTVVIRERQLELDFAERESTAVANAIKETHASTQEAIALKVHDMLSKHRCFEEAAVLQVRDLEAAVATARIEGRVELDAALSEGRHVESVEVEEAVSRTEAQLRGAAEMNQLMTADAATDILMKYQGLEAKAAAILQADKQTLATARCAAAAEVEQALQVQHAQLQKKFAEELCEMQHLALTAVAQDARARAYQAEASEASAQVQHRRMATPSPSRPK